MQKQMTYIEYVPYITKVHTYSNIIYLSCQIKHTSCQVPEHE
jgi:hypothetical protein